MTIKTFWTIFLKILGLWIVKGSLYVIPQFYSVFYFSTHENDSVDLIFWVILIIAVYVLLLRLFLFKTAWLIRILRLDKGFGDNKLELNIDRSAILSIAIIVIGGITFVDTLPYLFSQLFELLRNKSLPDDTSVSMNLLFDAIKVIIAYILMTNSKSIVQFIIRHSPENKNE